MARKDESEAIQAAGRKWQEANARGDKAGMEAAHREAEALRAKSGYSGGSDGSKNISLGSNKSSGGSTSKTPTAPTAPGKTTGSGNGASYYSSLLGGDYKNVDLAQLMKDADAAGKAKEYAPALYDAWKSKVSTDEYSQYDTEENRKWWESFLEPSLMDGSIANLQEIANQTYENPYQDYIDDQLAALKNRKPFTYDPLTDQLYQIAAKQYGMMGEKAMQDTLAEYATMTGGLPSSYAMSAAQQAQNEYNSKLSSLIPELEQAAYARYQGDYQMDYDLLSQLLNLDKNEYYKFADARDLGVNINQYLAGVGYNQDRDKVTDQQWQDQFDYTVKDGDRNYDLNVRIQDAAEKQAAIENDQKNQELAIKQYAAQNKGSSGGGKSSGSGSSKNGSSDDTSVDAAVRYMRESRDPETGEVVTGKDGKPLSAQEWYSKFNGVLSKNQRKECQNEIKFDERDDKNDKSDGGIFDFLK